MTTELIASEEVQELQAQIRPNGLANLPTVDLMSMKEMPNLSEADVLPLDLSSEYWTPLNAGEAKRLLFVKIEETMVQDINDPSILFNLPCAFFLEQANDGIKQIRNGSRRLVAALENLTQGTPLLVTYRGKIRNKTNSFSSDNWSIKPLILKV